MKWFSILAVLVLILPSHESHALQATKAKEEKKVAKSEAKKEKKPEFIRLSKDGRYIATMDTNVVRYTDSIKYPGATVDLIGAIHLGDPAYYDKLNKLFEQYDVLLYEAVKEEGAEIGKGEPPRGGGVSKDGELSADTMVGLSAIGTLQVTMKDVLGLEFQMQGIDYTKKNFVHADMTTREFQKSMRDRGETFASMMLKEMGKSMGRSQANPLAQQVDLLLSMTLGSKEQKQIRMRRSFAKQLAEQGAEEAFADENGESTIITERNKKALEVLERELDKGHKKIGVFYGAAHMPDMEKRLMDEFYFTRGDVKWLAAWDMRMKSKKKKKSEKKPAAAK